jgi:hypothetical protein
MGDSSASMAASSSSSSPQTIYRASPSSPSGSLLRGVPDDLQQQIIDLRCQVESNTGDIASNKRMIKKTRLEGEIANMIGKFRILGYKWKVTDFKVRTPTNPSAPSSEGVLPPTTVRRKFIKMMMRVVFDNQGLIAEDQNVDILVDDCYPAMGAWFDDGPLEVVWSDTVLWHAVKEKLVGRPLNIKIRVLLPRILHCIYDDVLRYRRTLLDANGTQTLYIDIKRQEPYIILMEKKMVDGVKRRVTVQVKWLDPR